MSINVTNSIQSQKTLSKPSGSASAKASGEVSGETLEMGLFDQMLTDQMENGDISALSAEMNPELMAMMQANANQTNDSALLANTNQKQDPLALLLSGQTKPMTAEETAMLETVKNNPELIAAFKVAEAQAPVVAGKTVALENNKAAQAQLGESDNVVQLMNNKKIVKPQANPYGNYVHKSMFAQANKDAKIARLKAEGIMTSPEGEMLKKADLLGDMNKAVQALAKNDNGEVLGAKVQNKDVKVLDLSKIQASNTNELINKISDHVAQNAVASKGKVEMAVHHDELGRININVGRVNHQQVNVEIQTMTQEAHKFFQTHQADLLGHLSTQGVNVADLKLESSNSSSSNQDMSGQFSNRHGQNQAEDNNRRDDSKRRDDLWNLLRQDVA